MPPAHQPTKPPAVPPKPVAPPATAPAKEMYAGGVLPADLNLSGRYRRAVSLIDSNPVTPPQYRGMLQAYYGYGTPFRQDTDFPRSLRRHPANRENGRESGLWNVLYFHLGSTASAIQLAYTLDRQRNSGAKEQIDVALARLKHLESLVDAGPGSWYVLGDDMTGYHLDTKPAPPVNEMVFDTPLPEPKLKANDDVPPEEE